MSRAQKYLLGILGYVVAGAMTAALVTAVFGPAAPSWCCPAAANTADRSIVVALFWPIALVVTLWIAAGEPK